MEFVLTLPDCALDPVYQVRSLFRTNKHPDFKFSILSEPLQLETSDGSVTINGVSYAQSYLEMCQQKSLQTYYTYIQDNTAPSEYPSVCSKVQTFPNSSCSQCFDIPTRAKIFNDCKDNQTPEEMLDCIKTSPNLPSGCVTCIGEILCWFFPLNPLCLAAESQDDLWRDTGCKPGWSRLENYCYKGMGHL